MFHKILLSSFAIFTLMNCQSQKLTKESDAKKSTKNQVKDVLQENLIYLNEGQTNFLKEQQMNVTFKGIISDSRCPTGVNCIWAGAAKVSVEVMTTTSRPMLIELSSLDLTSRNFVKTQNFAGYNITLEKVLPYPNQTNNTATLKGQYQIALKIEKGNVDQNNIENPVTTQ